MLTRARNDFARLNKSSLEGTYCPKAVFLKHVAPDASLYSFSYEPASESESDSESLVVQPPPVDQTQTAVAFAPVGQGWLGYIGDVNNEEGSQKFVTTTCDYALDWVSPSRLTMGY